MKEQTGSMVFFRSHTREKHMSVFLYFMFFVVASFVVGCKKGNMNIPGVESTMVINFDQTTIPIYEIDSAVVIIKHKSATTGTRLYMQKNGATMKVNLDAFSRGIWNTEVFIYRKQQPDGRKRLYVQTRRVNAVVDNGRIELLGPKGTINDSWKSRVIISNAAEDISLFIPLDNTDPYFAATVKRKKWKYLYIERYAYQTVGGAPRVVGAYGWDCDGDCFQHSSFLENNVAFATFAESIKSKIYNAGKIKVVLADDQNIEDTTIEYSYNIN
jgi:hypothetical protein